MGVLRPVLRVTVAWLLLGTQAFAQSVYMYHAWDNQAVNLDDCIGRATHALQNEHFKTTLTNEFADGRDVFGSGRSVVVLIHCVRMQSGVHVIIITSGANSKVAERARDQFRTKLFGTPPSKATETPAVNAKGTPRPSSPKVRQNNAKSPQQINSANSSKRPIGQSPKKPTKHVPGKTSRTPVGTQASARDFQQKHLTKSKVQSTERDRPTSVKNPPAAPSTRCHRSRQVSTQCRLQQKAQQSGNTVRSVHAGNVKAAIVKLNGDDRQALRTRCIKVLSDPSASKKSQVDVCKLAVFLIHDTGL
jgi:hypothetical protein